MEKAFQTIKETLKKSDPEGTRAPFWIIIDPKQNMSLDISTAAYQFTGVFFSREDAEDYLEKTRYNFSKRAKVYCHSGHQSVKYENIFKEI